MKGTLTRREIRRFRHRVWASCQAKRQRTLARWVEWVTACMADAERSSLDIRNLWMHFQIGSKEDEDPQLREAAHRALRVLMHHPNLPPHLFPHAWQVDPHAILASPAWQIHAMADPALEADRLTFLAMRERRLMKALNFGLIYGTTPAVVTSPVPTPAALFALLDRVKP